MESWLRDKRIAKKGGEVNNKKKEMLLIEKIKQKSRKLEELSNN